MDKKLLGDLEDSIREDYLFDFISNHGYQFSTYELVDLLKEVVYVTGDVISRIGTKDDVKSLGVELMEDLKENTSLFEED